MAEPNFIPWDLREQLRTAAADATKKGDRDCADRLQQLADYDGNDAPAFIQNMQLHICHGYEPVRELLRLVGEVKAARGDS